MIKNKIILWIAAILGSIIGYFTISLFIIDVTILQYIAIEAIISILHLMYNTVKSVV